jgi:nicotinate-nucleotide adenylyltransferase
MESNHSGERICVFGGTFDPIHIAHIRIAEAARDKFALDRVLLVPAGNPPHKDAFTPFADRLHMVELACQGHAGLSASALESSTSHSYTIDTIQRVCQDLHANDRLFFLIGADAFDDLETWKGWQQLVQLTEFIVVARPESEYRVPAGAKVHHLDGLALQVSSSGIRAGMAAGSATPELDDKVRTFIEERGLYGSKKEDSTVLP